MVDNNQPTEALGTVTTESIFVYPRHKVKAGDTIEITGKFKHNEFDRIPVGYHIEFRFDDKLIGKPLEGYATRDFTRSVEYKIPGDLPEANYKISVQTSEDAEPETFTLKVHTPPTPGKGKVEISTQPSGAKVFREGRMVGRTPETLEADSGWITVTIKKEGYKTIKRNVHVEEGKIRSVTFPLEKTMTKKITDFTKNNSKLLAAGGVIVGAGYLAYKNREKIEVVGEKGRRIVGR